MNAVITEADQPVTIARLCPFCGGDRQDVREKHGHQGQWEVYCQGSKTYAFGANVEGQSREHAIEYWNSRSNLLPSVDTLAQIIRLVNGNNDMGAGALAEAIIAKLEVLARARRSLTP